MYIEKAKKIIAGGVQLRSKDPRLFTYKWPYDYDKAKGIEITIGKQKYLDFSTMGIGCCTLGYANKYVNNEVIKSIKKGNMTSLNNKYEIEYANKLNEYLKPKSKMLYRFGKTGADVCSQAIRIARAYTNRDKIAIMGYHGHHDWFLAANIKSDNLSMYIQNISSLGVPGSLMTTVKVFDRTSSKCLNQLSEKYAAVIIEPFRFDKPDFDFLRKLSDKCNKLGIVLIFDLITIGFRSNIYNELKKNNINPDITLFSKSVANGYPLSVLMLKKHFDDVINYVFISSTYFTEASAYAAGIATLNYYIKHDVVRILNQNGIYIKNKLQKLFVKYNFYWEVSHNNTLIHWEFDNNKQREFFIDKMLGYGFLATNALYVCIYHGGENVRKYLKAVDCVLYEMKLSKL